MVKKTTTKKRATSRSSSKKSTTTKRNSTKKKVTTKTPTKKKPAVKKKEVIPIIDRDEIFLCSKVYNNLIKKSTEKKGWSPNIYLLGEDDKQIVREMTVIARIPGRGCDEMPSVGAKALIKGYLRLAKKKLVPVGLARINKHVGEGGHWYSSSGDAIYRKVGYILTVSRGVFLAEVFVPNNKNSNRNRYSHDYMGGRIKQLTVLLTDK